MPLGRWQVGEQNQNVSVFDCYRWLDCKKKKRAKVEQSTHKSNAIVFFLVPHFLGGKTEEFFHVLFPTSQSYRRRLFAPNSNTFRPVKNKNKKSTKATNRTHTNTHNTPHTSAQASCLPRLDNTCALASSNSTLPAEPFGTILSARVNPLAACQGIPTRASAAACSANSLALSASSSPISPQPTAPAVQRLPEASPTTPAAADPIPSAADGGAEAALTPGALVPL